MTLPYPKKTKSRRAVPSRSDKQMRRIALAGFTGTVIEFYDLTLYAVTASLVFAKVFFPALGPAAGTLAAFGTLSVAFVARPVGALIFGHFGDRLGRKRMLVITLLLLGSSTVMVGAMPTANQIGAAAPILIVLMRIVQGVAAGGELAGAALFSTESAPTTRRGFWTMFTSLGGGFSIVLANATRLQSKLACPTSSSPRSDGGFPSWRALFSSWWASTSASRSMRPPYSKPKPKPRLLAALGADQCH